MLVTSGFTPILSGIPLSADAPVDVNENALARLKEGVAKCDEADDLSIDGVIQRFEFAWKTLKALFEDEGLTGLNSPKTVLREAFVAELIKDEELWLDMLSDRLKKGILVLLQNIWRYAFTPLRI